MDAEYEFAEINMDNVLNDMDQSNCNGINGGDGDETQAQPANKEDFAWTSDSKETLTNGKFRGDGEVNESNHPPDEGDFPWPKKSEEEKKLLQKQASQDNDDLGDVVMDDAELQEYYKNIEILDEILGITDTKVKDSEKKYYKNSKEKEKNLKNEFTAIARLCGKVTENTIKCCITIENDDETDADDLGTIDIEVLKKVITRLEKRSPLPCHATLL